MFMKLKKFIIIFISIIILIILSILGLYKYNTSSVSNNSATVKFKVENNQTFLTLASSLKENDLIKSEFFYKIYIKLNKPTNLNAGTFILNKNMSNEEIIKILSNSPNFNESYRITFKEGLNMRKIIKLICENTNIKQEEIIAKLNNTTYLNSLIKKYWFLSNDIKNKDIYYSLEGYLFPDTYEFNKDANIGTIFETMLDNTEKKLEPYKTNIKNSKYSLHEIITLASIVELEAGNSNDRAGVAGVFYNRLENNWSLGSDVTTYYASKVDVNERDLYQTELDAINAYNTRSSSMVGKLPVGPICNPGIESIKAAISPKSHNYFYFVADKNKKTYFTVTYNQHLATISNLKSENLWYQY